MAFIHALDQSAAKAAAEKEGCQPAGGVRWLMSQSLDGVVIADPDWYGWYPLQTAVEQRRHAYAVLPDRCELAIVETLQQQTAESGLLVFPELRLRWTPATLRLRELLATELGPVQEIEVRPAANADVDRCRAEMELIDWCRIVTGTSPELITCRVSPDDATRRTTRLHFPTAKGETNPVQATLTLPAIADTEGDSVDNLGRLPRADIWPFEFSVRCRSGEARLEDAVHIRWRIGGVEHVESLATDRTSVSVAIDHFARRLAGGLIPAPDLTDVATALRWTELAERSFAAGGAKMRKGTAQ